MAASALERAVVSDWLVETCEEVGLTGKVVAPEGGGWRSDPAQVDAKFVPYSVVAPNTATAINPSFDDPSQDWSVPYTITSYGVDVNQVEDQADSIRKLLLAIKKEELVMSESTWKVTTIRCSSMGGVGYTTAVDPTAFSQTDTFILTLSRSLT